MTRYITEPAKQIPIIATADLCIAGGSCTGVFAAIRAARMGLKVVLIERSNMLGGVAVNGLVNIWHSLHDIYGKEQIIAGLTAEMIERLQKRNAIEIDPNPNKSYTFNTWELAILLDELVKEHHIQVMLHTSYTAVVKEGKKLQAVIVENTDGRGAVAADFFIDATGDGRIAKDLNIPSYTNSTIQPPSSCFHLQGNFQDVDVNSLVRTHCHEFDLEDDWGWSSNVAGCKGISMRADNHVFQVRCDKADDLTFSEIEGRRQAKAFLDLIRKYGRNDTQYAFTALSSCIGVRETVHYETSFQAKAEDLLLGKRYDAPIMNGSYRIDIHHSENKGITFLYLDGREETFYGKYTSMEIGNWREKRGLSGEPAAYYQIPFQLLVGEYDNFIAVGRMIHADEGAYGALRVMVNLNQLGEAAGTAAALCVDRRIILPALDGRMVTAKLRKGGSIL